MNFSYTANEIGRLAENAISIRFQSSNPNFNSSEYTITAMPNSIPITSYLNNVKVVSYDGTRNGLFTSASSKNWIGSTTAKNRTLVIGYGQQAESQGEGDTDFRTIAWQSGGNQNGIHIFPDMYGRLNQRACKCDWLGNHDKFDDIDILFGLL